MDNANAAIEPRRQPRKSPWGVVVRWKCVGAHDRCHGCGECPYCEPVYLHDLAALARQKRRDLCKST